jgi:hypothetical protein
MEDATVNTPTAVTVGTLSSSKPSQCPKKTDFKDDTD